MKIIHPCTYEGLVVAEDQLNIKDFKEASQFIKRDFGKHSIILKNIGKMIIFWNGSTIHIDQTGKTVLKKLKDQETGEEILKKIRKSLEVSTNEKLCRQTNRKHN